MVKHGKLKVEDFGFTMPINDPVAHEPPYFYRNIESMSFTYETDYETAAEMVPVDIEFADDPPVASVMVSKFGFSTFGSYNEVDIVFFVKYKGKKYAYIPNLYVTQEAPLIGGREIWGYGKKLSDIIEITKDREQIIGIMDRPKGNRLMTAVMRPHKNVEASVWEDTALDLLSPKLIPSAEEGKPPEVNQLIGCAYRLHPIVGTDGTTELWEGPGKLEWTQATEQDKLFKAPVKKMLWCTYGWFNIYLPWGYIVKDYNKE